MGGREKNKSCQETEKGRECWEGGYRGEGLAQWLAPHNLVHNQTWEHSQQDLAQCDRQYHTLFLREKLLGEGRWES